MNARVRPMEEQSRTPAAAACHRGKIVFRSLAGMPARDFFLYVPHQADAASPVVVLVHGIARNAAEHAFRFRPEADKAAAILVAPLFLADAYGQYQQVVDPRSGVRADLALFDMLAAVGAETGARADPFYLFGFSGGAQFAHRLAMLHPERVAAISVAAAGWYTLPDPELRYPLGIGSSPVSNRRFDPDRFLTVPRHVLIGESDVSRDASLRKNRTLDRLQGRTRLARAHSWFGAMERVSEERGVRSTPASLTLLPGAGHNFTEAAERHRLAETVFRSFGLLPPD